MAKSKLTQVTANGGRKRTRLIRHILLQRVGRKCIVDPCIQLGLGGEIYTIRETKKRLVLKVVCQ